MLDIHFFRNAFDSVKKGIAKKRFTCDLEKILELDRKRIEALKAFEKVRAEQQAANKRMAALNKQSAEFQKEIDGLKVLSTKVKNLESAFREAEKAFQNEWLTLPNLPHESVPIGHTAQENVTVDAWQPANPISNYAKPHFEIQGLENLLDFSRGNKVMGAGFPFYVGPMARLVRALIAFFLEEAHKKGYLELLPPLMVNTESATATGQLPDKEGLMYGNSEGYLIPTAEVPVTNFLRDEILSIHELPKKCCAYSPCFRREAGSWGKDVRGLNRLHQFDKVELVQWVSPETSFDALETLRRDAEVLLQKLELPYQVLAICSGDMGFPHSKQYDLEVWAGGQKRWLEVSSCSNFTDFQARRANIRYRNPEGNLAFVHTLNGSGLAIPRVLAAILENNLQADGSVQIPKILHKWMPETKLLF